MYTLDTQAAKESENFSNYLTDTGKYKGVFTRAEKLVSKGKGTHGIGFTFKDVNNRTTKFDIWTTDATGKHLFGYNQLMALMTCMKLRQLTEANGIVEKYDYDQARDVKMEAPIFADLMNKPVGVVLRKTEYEKMKDGVKTGETAWRLEPFMFFEAASDFTASEILDRSATPVKLPAIIAQLEDKPLKKRTATTSAPASNSNYFDDDIAF